MCVVHGATRSSSCFHSSVHPADAVHTHSLAFQPGATLTMMSPCGRHQGLGRPRPHYAVQELPWLCLAKFATFITFEYLIPEGQHVKGSTAIVILNHLLQLAKARFGQLEQCQLFTCLHVDAGTGVPRPHTPSP